VTRVLSRVLTCVLLALVCATMSGAQPADGAATPFAALDEGPTQGIPVPGGLLTADLGSWSSAPDRYEFQWLRDGVPVDGATARDYPVQADDVGHQLVPYVTGHSGSDTAHFLGSALTVRALGSSLSLDVRRVHPRAGRARLVWTAITFVSTERPWTTDGGTVVAYRKKDRHWKALGSSAVSRGAAFVRLPWKRAPDRGTKVMVCFQGSVAVAVSCSGPDVVRRHR
jgi:hypothetical protein